MNTPFYPEFEPEMLFPVRAAFVQLANDPLWLERPACPYSADTKEAMHSLWVTFRLLPSVATEAVSSISDADDKWAALTMEMTKLFDELRGFSAKIDVADVKEKMAYFRTATSLLEKITSLAERATNVKTVSDFQAKVLAVFDEVLTPEQRTKALKKLEQ